MVYFREKLKTGLDFVNKRRKMIFSLLFLFVICGGTWFLLVDPTSAVTSPTATGADSPGFWISLITNMLLYVAQLFIKLTLFVMTFVIQIAGYNGYLDSTAVNVGWVMVRDVTNMFFVVILLIIAFGTILGVEQYEWKKLLVKFIFAAVLVNFSRIICGVFIDVAQVFMATFVNGVAATAGGNLIQAFELQNILNISGDTGSNLIGDWDYFIAGVAAVTFSAMVLGTMAVFLVMLVARMIVLWVLIVLSPLAFVLSVLPQTQKHASEWWSQFGSNIITGPVLLFFLWLSLVTVGGGDINRDIAEKSSVPQYAKITEENLATADYNKNLSGGSNAGAQSSGIGQAMAWNRMASFAIAIGMLLIGAKVASQMGGVGGSWAGGAIDFGKKVAAIASGYTAAKWAAGGIKKGAAASGKFVLAKTPFIGGDAWKRRGKSIAAVARGGWEKFNQGRNKYVSDTLEKGSKQIQKNKLEREQLPELLKSGEITREKYDERMKKLEASEKENSGAGQWLKRRALGVVGKAMESGGRADKKVENLEKAAEAEHKITESQYSTSSLPGGIWKTKATAKMQIEEAKGKAKGETKVADMTAFMYARDMNNIKELEERYNASGSDDDKKALDAARSKSSAYQKTLSETAVDKARGTQASLEGSMKNFYRGGAGKGVVDEITAAEAGKTAAENLLKIIKGKSLTEAFQKAAEKMRQIIEKGGDVKKGLEDAAAQDTFVRQLVAATEMEEDEDSEKIAQTRAQEAATAGIIDLPKFGKEKPSLALDPMVEKVTKRLKSLEAQDGGAMAATMVARVLNRKKKLAPGEKLSDFDQASMFAAVAHITKEGWTDDTIGEISALFQDLNSKKFTDSTGKLTEQGEDVQAMKDIFVGQLGLIEEITDPSTGAISYSSKSNVENAAALQNLVAMGGDMKMVGANKVINDKMTELEKLGDGVKDVDGLTNKSTYEEVAKKLSSVGGAAGALGMSFDDFKAGLKGSQSLLQDASSLFKRAALEAGHVQMGGHQIYDRDMGMYRMNNTGGARKLMVTELGKRKGVLESAQIHSYGTINNETGEFEEINEEYTRALTAGETSARRAHPPSRTTDKLTGYDVGEQRKLITQKKTVTDPKTGKKSTVDVSYGQIGGGKINNTDKKKKSFAKKVLLKGIRANSEGMKIMWGKKLGVNDDDSDEGYTKFAVDLGGGHIVTGDYYSDFLKNLSVELDFILQDSRGRVDPKEKASFEQSIKDAIATSSQKEEAHRGRSGAAARRKSP